MWNRRKEEEPATRTSGAVPAPSELSREGIPMSTISHRETLHTDTHRVASSAVIGKSVVIKGQIYSREDLVIDGEVEGSVEANENKIVVGPNGKVSAGVKAREVVVHGAIRGNVEAGEKIDIRREAKLVGDIKTQRIVIEDGAYFKGTVDIQRPDAQKQQAANARAAQSATAATPAAGSPQQQSLTGGGTPPIEIKK
jgi:cytoskeletal protein CcmA (bactofilin family)